MYVVSMQSCQSCCSKTALRDSAALSSADEYILVGLSRCRLRPTNFENPDLHGWQGGGVARGCKFAGAGQFYFDLPLPGWSIGGCRQLDQVAI